MKEKLYLRSATKDDLKLLFDWVNEPSVRQNSFNTASISFEEHSNWFKRVLNDINTKLYIMEEAGIPVGQVRLVFSNNRWQISYSIDSAYRGQGYGKIILQLAEDELIHGGNGGEELYAEVKKENIASQRIFKKLGYSEVTSQHDNAYAYTKVVTKEETNGIK